MSCGAAGAAACVHHMEKRKGRGGEAETLRQLLLDGDGGRGRNSFLFPAGTPGGRLSPLEMIFLGVIGAVIHENHLRSIHPVASRPRKGRVMEKFVFL